MKSRYHRLCVARSNIHEFGNRCFYYSFLTKGVLTAAQACTPSIPFSRKNISWNTWERYAVELSGRDSSCGSRGPQLIRGPVADMREKQYDAKGIGCYMFRLNDEFIIDATKKVRLHHHHHQHTHTEEREKSCHRFYT